VRTALYGQEKRRAQQKKKASAGHNYLPQPHAAVKDLYGEVFSFCKIVNNTVYYNSITAASCHH
jgi:hypothetical protein